MRVVLKHEGVTKVLDDVTSYDKLIRFSNENFPLNRVSSEMQAFQYVDLDGDRITIVNSKDFEAMMETVTGNHIKLEISSNCLIQLESSRQLSDINRSRLISETQMTPKYEQQGSIFFQEPKKQAFSKMTHRGFQTLDKKQTKLLPSYCIQNQQLRIEPKESYPINSELKDVAKQECSLKTPHLNDNIKELIEDRIKLLINQKVQEIIPNIKKAIHSQLEKKYKKELEIKNEPMRDFKKNKKTKAQQGKCKHKTIEQSIQQQAMIKITDQCFKLAQKFGKKPKHYEQFVSQNFGLSTNKLKDLYKKHLLELSQSNSEATLNQKQEVRMKKLGFYFKEDAENFRELVTKNPKLKFKQLVSVLEEGKVLYQRQSEHQSNLKRNSRTRRNYSQYPASPNPKISLSDKKLRIKPIQLQKICNVTTQSREHIGSQSERIDIHRRISQPTNRRSNDQVLRKAEFLILFKQLFGKGNLSNYLSFYENNKLLDEKKLVQKWIIEHAKLSQN